MGFLRRIAGILGFLKDDPHDVNDEDEDADRHHNREDKAETRRPTSGFSVKVPVAVDRAYMGPVLTPCDLSDGGVQGLIWFAKRLRIDEDGDVADEFLEEVLPGMLSGLDDHKSLPKFVVKNSTRPTKVRNQVIAIDGRIIHCVEFQGRLLYV
ncbi:uncharacterized protein LOC122664932 [Telopea speciosissima]|uniref:uncharacterized protein LOC122664932 n=1 Tax=Telopea speciosissima TaxID=54955 RepID=UPI001CC783C6|nr:uncharacterized protein LOC122664932 [Telopea speciosissima]XP_043716907.1 uncharacterized protein LOC122664932 [Telopea speciosissima]